MAIRLYGFGSSRPLTEVLIYDPVAQSWALNGSVHAGADRPDQMGPSALAVDGNDNVFVTWLQESEVTRSWQVWANRLDSATGAWSPTASRLENAGQAQPGSYIDIDADAAGNAIVVWSQDVGASGTRQLRVRASRYSIDDHEWSPAEQVDDVGIGTEAREIIARWLQHWIGSAVRPFA